MYLWTSIALIVATISCFAWFIKDRRYKSWRPPLIVWAVSVGAIVGCSAVLISVADIETHQGRATGYVTAVEHGGVFYKTTTVYFKTDAESTQEDKYCVEDNEIAGLLRKYADLKQRVRLSFTTHLLYSEGCWYDQDSTIRAVVPIGGG